MKILKWFIPILFIFNLTAFAQTANTSQPVEPIAVDQAFQFSASARDNQTILAMWKIAPGYYLYRHRFHFSVVNPKSTRIGQPLLPVGITKTNPEVGQYEVYSGSVTIPIPVIQTKNTHLELKVNYQGCSEKGFCYPPTTKVVPINLAGDYMKPVKGVDVTTPLKKQISNGQLSQQSKIKQLLSGSSLWTLLLGFLGFGVLISLTPCVLPMIPILSGIIVGQGKISTARSFGLSVAYVLGMAITYAIAGVIFGMIGGTVQAALQQPWIIVLFSLLFVAMALSLFGFYNIQLPQKLRSKMAHASKHQKRGTYVGVLLMGCFSTLVLSPCVTPPLVAVLSYIGQTGSAALGGIALFTMGIGMGVPLLAIGAFGTKLLPKSGAWMNATKNIMGILLIAVAIWMLVRIIPGTVGMLLWAALAIGTAIYMGALSTATTKWRKIGKSIGLILFIYGILLVVGATTGSSDPLNPTQLVGMRNAQKQGTQLKFIAVKTISDVNRALGNPKNRGKPVMLDFYADWCISCKEMDHFTFNNSAVKKRLAGYVLLRADVTENNMDDKMLERRFNVVAPPTILFFDKNTHREIKNARIIGEMSAKDFLLHLHQLAQ